MTTKTFDQLKKNSSALSKDLFSKLKQSKEKKSYKDDRFWSPKQDAAGNASATIRFLPSPDTDEPYVQLWHHGFKHSNGKFFINNCPTTKGKPCVCCDENKNLWGSGIESDKDIVRDRKRKQSFFSNILVVNDPANPDNNGKVFLYKYGKKIHDKILDAMIPEDASDDPIDVFSMFEGTNFKLKIKKVSNFPNFDSSTFDMKVAPICGGDEAEMKKVFASLYSLAPLVADDQFKSYDKLKQELDSVLGNSTARSSTIEDTQDAPDEDTNKQLEELIKQKMNKPSKLDEDDIPAFDSKEDDSVPFDVDDDIDAQLAALIDKD